MVLDWRKDFNRARDWMVPPISHQIRAWGAIPQDFFEYVQGVAAAIDGGIRPLAASRKLKVSGYPKTVELGAVVPYRSPALFSWKVARFFRPAFRVEIRQDTLDLAHFEITGRITFPLAAVVSLLVGFLLESLFWPPPNIFRPWPEHAIVAVAIVGVVVFAYSLKHFGIFNFKVAGLLAGGVAFLGYVFWPLWFGMALGFVLGLRMSKMQHEQALRGAITQAFGRADTVPRATPIKMAAVAGAPRAPIAVPAPPPPPPPPPPVPSPAPAGDPGMPCPICGTSFSAAWKYCPSCGFAGVG